MNKRILSMLLALVMLFSMLPVQALAEEEPTAEETIVEPVVTEPAATEPAATKPAATEPAATEPAATKPAATEPAATEPAATEPAATEPAATEPVVTEPVVTEPVTAVAAESVTVLQEEELKALAVGETLQLAAVVLPEDTTDQIVVWTSSDDAIAVVDETGLVTGVAAGNVTITAACGAVMGTYDLEVQENVEQVQTRDEPADKDDGYYSIVLSDENPTELLSGEAVTLKATLVDSEGYPSDAGVLVWTLPEYPHKAYANLELSGKLSADPGILEKHTIKARVSAVGVEAEPQDLVIDLIPTIKEITLLVDGEELVDGEYAFNLNNETLVTDGVLVTAAVLPEDARHEVKYTVKDSLGLSRSLDEGGGLRVKPKSGKIGTITVTATAEDGSGKTAKMTIRFVKIATEVEILNAPEQMRGGNSCKLTTNVATEAGLSDRGVIWEVSPEDYASIDEDGTLTTKAVEEKQTITVTARLEADPDVYGEAEIELCPAVESIKISLPDGIENPVTFTEDPIALEKEVYPEDAEENVKWTSNNIKVATVDAETGVVTLVGSGKVRITCEATDGTRVKDMLNLEIVKPVEELTIDNKPEDDEPLVLVGGDSVNLKTTTWMDRENGLKADNQKVTWSIGVYGDEGELEKTTAATISSSGRVTAKSVKRNTRVTAIAVSEENEEVFDEVDLLIKPSQRKSFMLYLNGEQLVDGVLLNAGDTYVIEGMCYDSDDGEEGSVYATDPDDCIFYSSNKKVATIDENGNVEAKASGSTTITVQWEDPETGRMYTCKGTLKVTKLVREVSIAEPKYDYVRSGSSLTLKATAWTNRAEEIKASNQKFTWKLYEVNADGDEVETKVATVSSSGKVSAKTVTRNTDIRVYALSAENGLGDSVDLVIRPKQTYQLDVIYDDGEEDKTGTVTLEEVTDSLSDLRVMLYTSAKGNPDDGAEDEVTSEVKWSSSNKKVVKVDEYGDLELVGLGKTTLTAKYTIGKTTVSGKITLNVVRAVSEIEISLRNPGQNLFSGKSTYMKAVTYPIGATNKSVKWSFADGSTSFTDETGKVIATIDPNTGMLSAKRGLTERVTVSVMAVAKDGFGAESETCDVTIYPLATKVTIRNGSEEVEKKEYAVVGDKLYLTAEVETVGQALDEVKWTSSSSSVASVDENGVVTVKKTGAVSIRATTKDGSGKYASFTLIVSK